PLPRSRKASMADSLNCVVYLLMKNTPEVGWVSNFWGALHRRCPGGRGLVLDGGGIAKEISSGKTKNPADLSASGIIFSFTRIPSPE
ncbi:hypothetical protein, partial [Pseudomonas sp. DSP3-2-3]